MLLRSIAKRYLSGLEAIGKRPYDDNEAGWFGKLACPLRWGDEDAFGHLNNKIYFSFCEDGRVQYMSDVGAIVDGHSPISVILQHTSLDYKLPMDYPDVAHVRMATSNVGKSSWELHHEIWSQQQCALAAKGVARLVFFDYRAKRVAPIPDAVRQRLQHDFELYQQHQ
jgi:acyl-CoA thioester hydrolase